MAGARVTPTKKESASKKDRDTAIFLITSIMLGIIA